MTKRIIKVPVISNSEIAEGIFRLTIDCKAAAATEELFHIEPGQFLNLYLQDKSMLLPRPISICLAEDQQITLVYRTVGKGTRALAGYKAGDMLQISTPLGQGFRIAAIFDALSQIPSEEKTIALVAGGVGVAPMLELAKTIRNQIGKTSQIKLVAILGFLEESFLTEELKKFCDEIHIVLENGGEGFRGNVLELMKSEQLDGDYFLSCGPKPMLKALAAFCGEKDKPLQVSLEERMGCGYGACVGCTCGTKAQKDDYVVLEQKKVCKDGPVFFGDEVVWNA